MPEAAMDKDDRPVFWKHDVRFSGEFLVVEPEPVTGSVKERPHEHLGLCILALDSAHVP